MKCWLLLIALPLIAQFSEKEVAFGESLRKDALRNIQALSVPSSESYLTKLASNFDPRLEFELVNIQAKEPLGFPGGKILIPVNVLSKAISGADFMRSLAHAAGHVLLRHGFISRPGSISIYIDHRTFPPLAFKPKQAEWEQEAEQFANDFMSKNQLTQADSEAFLEAKSEAQTALKAQESAAPQAPSLVRKQPRSPRR